MPLANLSERFYEKFGHDLVEELVTWLNQMDTTYRTDLRELNELNYSRFDAKLEQRIAEVKADLRQEIAALRTELLADLHGTSASLFKWMFVFWAGTVVPLAGLMFALFGRGR